MDYQDYENFKINHYNYLMDNYIEIIINLVDYSYNNSILPLKLRLGINYFKNYINENRISILENGINLLLNNKEVIENFDLNNLDQLDTDDDDNVSIKQCVNNMKKNNNDINKNNENELLDLIIDIKNNTKKLNNEKILIIKKYFELLLNILQEIKNIF